ncbi:hypothetical protein Kfla_2185 [Kribbella flavida DSM 17836]|uniref:Uncharacterized protein n=1 Tax=Kribbella flavida (strain DSM 17836 / JCM 10339 / NBRC 14399) TaxID=479435 RepID=D2PTF1_KRIFD|nr:hypothetical protein [Kribbella flavida]ADB31264.1 hypothetical protein Kfla_2185 [Kribbella flavida DSM 17836]
MRRPTWLRRPTRARGHALICDACRVRDNTIHVQRGQLVALRRQVADLQTAAHEVAAALGRRTGRIVTICGSTRFRDAMASVNRQLTLAGYIVLAPGVFVHDGDQVSDDAKARLDRLHLAKIDLADCVYVVNPGGYVGDSTRREIEYAASTGKTVWFLTEARS